MTNPSAQLSPCPRCDAAIGTQYTTPSTVCPACTATEAAGIDLAAAVARLDELVASLADVVATVADLTESAASS